MLRVVRVSGRSMTPTYRPSDLLLTRRVGRPGPRRGDVVVLRHAGLRVLKRVVAGAGDVVELEAGRLAVEGRSVDGRPLLRGPYRHEWHVPAGHWFVAGDDPAASDDSRVWEEPFVADEDVEAVVVGRLPSVRRLLHLRSRRPAPGAARAA